MEQDFSFILAIALIATTFHSDLATIRVFADDAPAVDVPASEYGSSSNRQGR